ncbi:MAG TPA: class I SAM-dependent methyltransferase [Anaerovoracaceae bacterium]|nr:class I SAM-dependent methyltransferase [Anaerovoracaceae bacterium]
MKFRDSGMPNEQIWNTFFDPRSILRQMEVTANIKTLIDIGCGYGTFLIPASEIIAGHIVGVDIESEMIGVCAQKINEYDIKNAELICGDISTEVTLRSLDKCKGNADYITLFNILHCEQPQELLKNAYNLLNINGKVGVIHWIYGETPRGPALEVRPIPETIIDWAEKAGFVLTKKVDLPPYHFGLIFKK